MWKPRETISADVMNIGHRSQARPNLVAGGKYSQNHLIVEKCTPHLLSSTLLLVRSSRSCGNSCQRENATAMGQRPRAPFFLIGSRYCCHGLVLGKSASERSSERANTFPATLLESTRSVPEALLLKQCATTHMIPDSVAKESCAVHGEV
jgi:hypothetical protein